MHGVALVLGRTEDHPGMSLQQAERDAHHPGLGQEKRRYGQEPDQADQRGARHHEVEGSSKRPVRTSRLRFSTDPEP